MYNLETFRERVQELVRRTTTPDGGRASMAELAVSVGISRTELSRRMHGKVPLSARDVRVIVRVLAQWGAISTQDEALELLALVNCPPFTDSEWRAAPLDMLTPVRSPSPPAPKAQPLRPRLPGALTTFIGRGEELALASSLLTHTRLLTILGPGGVGKTRLATELARAAADRFAGRVYMVELASLTTAAQVAQAVAEAVGVREHPEQELMAAISAALGGSEALLLLDNCEHLREEVAQTAYQLLISCSTLRILATSRARLGVVGEQLLRLSPMQLPPAGSKVGPRQLAHYEAVQLFMARAREMMVGLHLNAANAAAVRQICERLDGLPLALELAAARVGALSLAEISSHLDQQFSLLDSHRQGIPARHQALTRVMEWSYSLLTSAEQRMMCLLSVFAGSFTLEAAVAVSGEPASAEDVVLELIAQLVDKSLLLIEQRGERTRYRWLTTIREYAWFRLEQSAETTQVRQRHAEYYLGYAATAAAQLIGELQSKWLTQLEEEHPNLRAALAWCIAQGEGALALALAASLWRFWYIRGHFSEGLSWLGQALQVAPAAAGSARGDALNGAGNLAWAQGDYEMAKSYYEQALEVRRALADRLGVAHTLLNLGNIAYERSAYADASRHYHQSLSSFRSEGDKQSMALCLHNLGNIAYEQTDYERAGDYYREALAINQELMNKRGIAEALSGIAQVHMEEGEYQAATRRCEESQVYRLELEDKRGIASSYSVLGDIAYRQGDYPSARERHEEALALRRELGNKQGIAISLLELARVAVEEGRYDDAYRDAREALLIRARLGHQRGIIEVIELLARVAVARDQPQTAALLFGWAVRGRELIGATPQPYHRAKIQQSTTLVRDTMGAQRVDRTLAVGHSMTLAQLLEQILLVESEAAPPLLQLSPGQYVPPEGGST